MLKTAQSGSAHPAFQRGWPAPRLLPGKSVDTAKLTACRLQFITVGECSVITSVVLPIRNASENL